MEIMMVARESRLVTLDTWFADNAAWDAATADAEPLDASEWGGEVATGSAPTMLASAVR